MSAPIVERLRVSCWTGNVTDDLTRWSNERTEAADTITDLLAIATKASSVIRRAANCARTVRAMRDFNAQADQIDATIGEIIKAKAVQS